MYSTAILCTVNVQYSHAVYSQCTVQPCCVQSMYSTAVWYHGVCMCGIMVWYKCVMLSVMLVDNRYLLKYLHAQDEYKSFLPSWRQEMKDNKIIKCPNFKV